MSCEHPHTGYMTWPEKYEPGKAHAAVNCCDLPACRMRANADVLETTGHEGIWVPFAPEVMARFQRTRIFRGQVWEWKGMRIKVRRVSRRLDWADVTVWPANGAACWGKRQPIPFPNDWELTEVEL